MKDPKNIKSLNLLATYYVTLHGLQGKPLKQNNPFAEYYEKLIFNGNMLRVLLPVMDNGAPENNIIVGTTFFHILVKEAYEFYQNIDEIDSSVHPMMKEQVTQQLGDMEFDEFMESSVNIYKNSFFELLNNYNSYKEDYVQIKLNVLKECMDNFAVVENYEKAAEMRDKIKKLEDKI